MAGRGRGRGKTVSFDVQALGFGRGESLPAASLQPPALFPPQQFKPVPLVQSADVAYLLALKQEFVGTLRKSPFFLRDEDRRQEDIERYSDKYQLTQQDGSKQFKPDYRRLPAELKIKEKKKRKIASSSAKPTIPKRRQQAGGDTAELEKTLQTLEKKEEETGGQEVVEENESEDEEKKEDEDNEEGLAEVLDEDDLEEETDYAMAYFDNGEGYGDDDGDDDEGPIY